MIPDSACTTAFGGANRVARYAKYAAEQGIPIKPPYPARATVTCANGEDVVVTQAQRLPVSWPRKGYVEVLINGADAEAPLLLGTRPLGYLNLDICFEDQQVRLRSKGRQCRLTCISGLWGFRALHADGGEGAPAFP
jgi:hypothetical protein